MPDIKNFTQPDWMQIWAGDWSLLSCSEFAEEYTQTLQVNGKVFVSKAILFFSDDKSSCFVTASDREAFGQHLAAEVAANPNRVQEITENFKYQVDTTLTFMKEHQKKEITPEIYRTFWDRILEYYNPHVNTKFIVDYLEKDLLEKYLPALEKARVYAEPVFKHSEEFMRAFAQQMSEKVGYSSELVLCLVKEELPLLFKNKKLPSKATLQQRYQKSALLADASGQLLRVGDEVAAAEQLVDTVTETNALKGTPAFPGIAKGAVRVILDPTKADHFQEGDILVTGMTRPEYLPNMKKAAAIVTNAGGILSHAAITARELKIPCVIGTNHATKVLKNGDQVEVDANQGLVRIIE